MRRRLLIITKEPEFDSRNEVVLGQCEPFTSGWSLYVAHVDGTREKLAAGSYTDLRRMQESCAEIEKPEDLRKRIADLRVLMTASVTETLAVRPRPSDPNEATKEVVAITPGNLPRQSPAGLLHLVQSDGVLVATVAQPERAGETNLLKTELLSVLESHPRAVIVDFESVSSLPAGSVEQLLGAREKLCEAGANLVLCNVSGQMQQKLKSDGKLPVFETQATAMAALKNN